MDEVAGDEYEIDLLEKRDFDINNKNIRGYITSAIHWDGYGAAHKSIGYDSGDRDLGEGFHIYGLEILENRLIFYIDGKKYWQIDKECTGKSMYLVLSAEFSYSTVGWVRADKNDFDEDCLIIDYVKIWSAR